MGCPRKTMVRMGTDPESPTQAVEVVSGKRQAHEVKEDPWGLTGEKVTVTN